MTISEQIAAFNEELKSRNAKLIAVSKKQPNGKLLEAYKAGQRDFGENYVQELLEKQASLPTDINWHMIGHLQSNKVKFIAPFVHLIHSVDSLKLLKEINKQALKNNRVIKCLLQVYIATEESKTGFSSSELIEVLNLGNIKELKNIEIIGLMGMASFTSNKSQIKEEYKSLQELFLQIKSKGLGNNIKLEELSMGMSSDWRIAIENGSTLIRVGSTIFGERNYA